MHELEEKYKHYEKIKDAINYMDENFVDQPKLEDIASFIGLSKHHFSRLFKEYVGVTPIQFLQATTLSHAKKHLEESKSLLETTFDVGLSSPSRLHELFVNFEAVTPNEYKKMGEDLEIVYGFGFTPFGKALIASTKKGVCALEFYEDENIVLEEVKTKWLKAKFIQNNSKAQELLDKIFVNKEKVDIFVKGTNFQINVWKALVNIPNSKTLTYSDIANYLGKPKSVRAVATAIGSNNIAYLIPCHRVISKTAAMAGYKWGINRKKIILSYEFNEKFYKDFTNK